MSKAIALPFSFDIDGRITSTIDSKKIVQDRIVLVIMTYLRERVMRPGFGTLARGIVFENTESAISMVKQEIASGFSTWLPYLTLVGIDVTTDSENVINVSIDYKYGHYANTETVTIKSATFSQSGNVITEV